MANYNTFLVIDCNKRTPLLTTSSARKAKRMLEQGVRIEVWNGNELKEKIYSKDLEMLNPYISAEKEYIREKQAKAEARNKRRRSVR